MKLVGYCRVSTENKDQNPERQRDILSAWATRNGHEVVHWVIDEGTSGGISPLERIQVGLAIKKAKELDAAGLLVESVDRWTRKGVHDFFQSSADLKLRHGLDLSLADVPQGMDGMALEIYQSIMAIVAKAFRERLREQIISGIARAKKEGWKKGRPGKQPKANLSPEETAYVREQRSLGRRGAGWGRMATEITRRRGALEVVDRKARDKRIVSASWVRAEWLRISSGSMVRRYRPVAINPPNAIGVGTPQGETVVAMGEIANSPKVAE